MISFASGNIFESGAEAIVNPVNCVGVMGKGLAQQFKSAFPENYASYKRACLDGLVKPGTLVIHDYGMGSTPRYIINFPTKRHYRDASRIEDIEIGLQALVVEADRLALRSLALPALGCGLGGLSWPSVKALIAKAFQDRPTTNIIVYAPKELCSSQERW